MESEETINVSRIKVIAQILRGFGLGVLLFVAITALFLTSTGATLFRYQGF